MQVDEGTLAVARIASAGIEPGTDTVTETLRSPPIRSPADSLARLRAIRAGSEPLLTLTSTIGEGGMGQVMSGVQQTLGRGVAVKTLRDGIRSDDVALALVHEAAVLGALEHPHIVPVYDLAVSDDGMPVLMMKRIAGTTWAKHLVAQAGARSHGRPESPPDVGSSDALEWNLRTLMAVCQAVHFAHSRNIVHRDLKPTNVMIGDFGEVYLVDWGIAVASGSPREPEDRLVGTLAYMAPEMLLGHEVSPRTDVYQLGAILYRILAGRGPHEAGGTHAALAASVIASTPVLPDGVPAELAAIVRACMAKRPEARPSSAEQVRAALADFLHHRGSALLAARADQRRAELERMIAEPAAGIADVQRVYGEVTFGYRAARETWPGNEVAREGMARATRAMVRHELARGMLESAQVRLAELEAPDAALASEVSAAAKRAADRARRDAAILAEHDPKTGRTARVGVTAAIGVFWALQPLVEQLGWLGPNATSHVGGALMAAVSIAFLATLRLAFRRQITRSRLNRQLVRVAFVVLFVQIVAYGAAASLGVTPAMTQTMLLFVWFCVCAVLGAALEVRFLAPALVFLAASLVAAKDPSLRLYAEAFANAVIGVSAAVTVGARRTPDGDGGAPSARVSRPR